MKKFAVGLVVGAVLASSVGAYAQARVNGRTYLSFPEPLKRIYVYGWATGYTNGGNLALLRPTVYRELANCMKAMPTENLQTFVDTYLKANPVERTRDLDFVTLMALRHAGSSDAEPLWFEAGGNIPSALAYQDVSGSVAPFLPGLPRPLRISRLQLASLQISVLFTMMFPLNLIGLPLAKLYGAVCCVGLDREEVARNSARQKYAEWRIMDLSSQGPYEQAKEVVMREIREA